MAPDPPSPVRRCRRIPVPFREVVARARTELVDAELGVDEVARSLEVLFGAECGAEEEEIKAALAPLAGVAEADERRQEAAARLPEDAAHWRRFLERFGALLERANYVRLGREHLEATASLQGIPGLRVTVDFSAYDRLEVFVRGTGTEVRHFRKWWWPWRRHAVPVPTHERVVLLARLATEVGLHVKSFRDIPEDDLVALLPGTRFKMRLFDHIKIGGAGSTAIVTYILRNAPWVLKAPAFALPIVIVGSVFYLGKTVWGYFRAKDTYRAKLMHELFYQMLDSDEGVVTRTVDEAEDEEAKETFLAWAVARHLGPCDVAALSRAAGAYLARAHGCTVEFDGEDAVAKVRRLRLTQANHDGLVRAVPAGVAAVRLHAANVARR